MVRWISGALFSISSPTLRSTSIPANARKRRARLIAMETVLVRKMKRPTGSGLWGAYVLGSDQHGQWLYSPVGCLYRGERDGAVGYCHVGEPDLTRPGLAVTTLIPPCGWWIASWARPLGSNRISVDICTPPVRRAGEWSYIDLELDLVSDQPAQVEIWDEDEFVEACAFGLIPPAEKAAALEATATIERLIRQQREPFGQAGWQKLDNAIDMNLDPLTELPSER